MASASIIGVAMTFVLTPNNGPANSLLVGSWLASQPIDFLGNPGLAIWSVLGVHTWKNLGITMIYWLAALQTVPAEYYEAARIDSAGWAQLGRHITMPILMPFSMIIIVLTAKENLQAFAIIQAMTQGGPYFSTEVIEVFIYQTAFVGEENGGVPRLGYASAAGCFFGTITLIFALVQLWVVRRVAETRRQLGAVKADAP